MKKKLAILTLVLMLALPIVAQIDKDAKPTFASVTLEEPEAKTQWELEDPHILLIQKFHQEYQEEYIKLIEMIKKVEMKINPDMPETALYNDQLQAFVIPKPKEEKKPEKKEK